MAYLGRGQFTKVMNQVDATAAATTAVVSSAAELDGSSQDAAIKIETEGTADGTNDVWVLAEFPDGNWIALNLGDIGSDLGQTNTEEASFYHRGLLLPDLRLGATQVKIAFNQNFGASNTISAWIAGA
jgi:hypothetical protein